jgi:hypothetical protein
MIRVLPGKPRPFKGQERSVTNGIPATANGTNFQEWEAALPEDFIGVLIRVDSENSWFKYSPLGHSSIRGSFTLPANQDVWI